MKRRQSAGLFLVINIVVSLAVALLVVSVYFSTQNAEEEPRARPTIVLIVTATPNPNQPLSADELQGTVDVLALTVTAFSQSSTQIAQSNSSGGVIPTREGEVGSQPTAIVPNPGQSLPTLDPALIPSLPSALSGSAGTTGDDTAINPTASPADGCERYTVQAGDTSIAIATRYGVTLSALLVLNGITEQTILQIGEVLLIPGETCQPDETPTATVTLRPTFNITLVAPTVTLAPTVENAQIEIVQVLNPGDITAEQVEIRNVGGEINLEGWRLFDEDGNTYTFPAMRLVQQQIVRVLSRSDRNTPGYLYWNLNSPVWEIGEVVSLEDAQGNLQSVATVGGDVIEFSTPDGN